MKRKLIIFILVSYCGILTGCTKQDVVDKCDKIAYGFSKTLSQIVDSFKNADYEKVTSDFEDVKNNFLNKDVDSITGDEKPDGYDGYEGMFDNIKENIENGMK